MNVSYTSKSTPRNSSIAVPRLKMLTVAVMPFVPMTPPQVFSKHYLSKKWEYLRHRRSYKEREVIRGLLKCAITNVRDLEG